MQTLDITLAASGTLQQQEFAVGGSYFELIEGQGAVDVKFTDNQGSQAADLEMRAALPGYYVVGPFAAFTLRNVSGRAQTVRVMFGSGVGGSRRVQGVVSTVDGGRQRTLDGAAFMAPCNVATVAGQNPHGQIWNPPGQGQSIVIKALHLASSTTGQILIRTDTAAFGGLFGTLRNKLLGGAAITGPEVRTGNSATIQGQPLGTVYVATAAPFSFRFEEPVIVPPGNGLFVVHANVATDLVCSFEGFLQ